MGDYRSKSYGDGRMEIESYYSAKNTFNNNNYTNPNDFVWVNPNLEPPSSNNNKNNNNGVGMQDLRCYSASYATTVQQQQHQQQQGGGGVGKEKSRNGSSSSTKAVWCFGDPELQRKKRVASYKSYSVEGKLKRSFTKSFRWIKNSISHGW